MNAFSATNKHVNITQQPIKSDSPSQARHIETSHKIDKSAKKSNTQSKEEVSKQLNKTVEILNKQMEKLDTNVKFGFNDKISIMYVSVLEKNTGNLIRNIPSDEAMSLSERMQAVIGTIFDKKG